MKIKIINQLKKYTDSDFIIYLVDNFIMPIFFVLSLVVIYKVIKQIVVFIRNRSYERKLALSGIKNIDRMDGFQFEFYLRALFKELGYKTFSTKSTHDFGADLIVKHENKKIAIQAKRYGYKNKVGVDAVQQVYTSLPFYKADEGWVITNSFFTNNASKLANVCKVKMLNRYSLMEYINKVNPSLNPKKVLKEVNPKERKCPQCQGKLKVRHSKKGNAFMGCSNFPNCKHTEPVAN